MTVRAASVLVAVGLGMGACGGEAFTAGGDSPDGSAGSATAGAGGSSSTGPGGGAGTGGSATAGAGGTGRPDGGTAGAGGKSGGGGADGGGCPAALPKPSEPCSQEGLSCAYGKCCPTHAICSKGTWQIAITDCAVPACPSMVPTQGSSCTCLSTQLPCHYGCGANMKSIDATCVNDVWSIQTVPCPVVVCAGSMCMPGEVCVNRYGPMSNTSHCAPNPCGSGAITCNCAASLCEMGYVCGANGSTLTCSCPQCI